MIKKILQALLVTAVIIAVLAGVEMLEVEAATTEEKINEVIELVETADSDVEMLAKILYTEARGVESKAEQAAVVWCVLNRVDNRGQTIRQVITARHQFAWRPSTPIDPDLLNLAEDVYLRWVAEKLGCENVGRVLPKEYEYFSGRNGRNWFRKGYRSKTYWDWGLKDPYRDTVTFGKEIEE